jgi:hypothetical protein
MTPLNMQVQISYESEGRSYIRMLNFTYKSSLNPLVFYKGLDANCISIILLRKYLKYSKSKPVKRVGNSMLDYFENMLTDYKNVREKYFAENSGTFKKIENYIGSELTAEELENSADFSDSVLPASLESVLLLLYCSLK